MGVSLIAASWMRGWRSGDEIDCDERCRKLATHGIACSWLVTFSLLIALLVLDQLGILSISSESVLELVVLVMAGSAAIFKWHLLRMGDLA